jgi:hypothetical protein
MAEDQRNADKEALVTARVLADALTGVQAEMKRLRRYGKSNRKFILLDIVLTLGLALSGVVSVHAVQSADNANSAQLALCQAGNVARDQQVQLWEYVLHLSAGKHQTAAQKQVAATFDHHLHVLFAPRNCAVLGRH